MSLLRPIFVLAGMTIPLVAQAPNSLSQSVQQPKSEIQSLLDKEYAAQTKGDWKEALRLAQQVLKLAQVNGKPHTEAYALYRMGVAYSGLGQREISAETLQKALAIFRQNGDRQDEAHVLSHLCDNYIAMGRPRDAVKALDSAKDLQMASGDMIRTADSLARMANLYDKLGLHDKQLEFYEKALEIDRQIGNKSGMSFRHLCIATTLGLMGRHEEQAKHLDQALGLAREDGDKGLECDALSNIGSVNTFNFGNVKKATEYYQAALTLARASGDRAREAEAYQGLGKTFTYSGELQKALENHARAAGIQTEIKDEAGRAGNLYAMGGLDLDLGLPQRALEHIQEALSLARKVKWRGLVGACLGQIASIYRDLGNPSMSLENHSKALAIYREVGNRNNIAICYGNIGRDLAALGREREALPYFQKSLSGLHTVGARDHEADLLASLGRLYFKMGRAPEALHYLNEALRINLEGSSVINQASMLEKIGGVYQKLGKDQRALNCFQKSISISESVRTSLGGYTESKSAFLSQTIPAYYGCLQLLLKQRRTEEAFALAQRTKARSLLDLLESGRVDVASALTAEERAQEQELRRQAFALNAAMVKQGVENEIGSKKRYAALKSQLNRVESKLQTLSDSLYARHPGLAQKRVANTTNLAALGRILPEDTALLDYVVAAKDDVRLFVVTKSGGKPRLSAYKVSGGYTALAAKAAAFHAACSDPRKQYRLQARSLYTSLIRPADKQLRGKRRLVLCPDGALWDVPFQALIPSPSPKNGRVETRALGARYEIAYAYSATGAAAALTMSGKRNARPAGSILVAANPDFGSSDRFGDLKDIPGQRPLDTASRPIDSASRPLDAASRPLDGASRPLDLASRAFESVARSFDTASRSIDTASRGKAIPSLPGTQREADSLRNLFPDAEVLTGARAQESAVKEKMGKYRYLHLATHGFVNDGSPLLSSVVLAKPNDNEDGFLTAREIYGLNLNAEMTVLSACNTARGETRTGEGVIGLTWALFVAGCPTQVVSQWAVDDASTAMLMGRFYEDLKVRKMGKAAALKEAQSWLRTQNPKYRHPYYWAPFVLNGAWK